MESSTQQTPKGTKKEPWSELLNRLMGDYLYQPLEEALPQLLELAANDNFAKVNILLRIASAFRDMGKIERSVELASEAREISKVSSKRTRAYFLLLENCCSESRYVAPDFQKIRDMIENDDHSMIGTIMCEEMWDHWDSGSHNDALKTAKQLLEMHEQGHLSDAFTEEPHRALGLVYGEIAKYEIAEYHTKKAIEIAERLGQKKWMAGGLSNLGQIYNQMGRNHDAISWTKKALQVIQGTSDLQFATTMLGNIGNSSFVIGDYDQAKYYISLEIEEADKAGLTKQSTLGRSNIGELYLKLDRNSEALKVLEEAYPNRQFLRPYNRISFYKHIIEASERQGKFSSALNYSRELRELDLDDAKKTREALLNLQSEQAEQTLRMKEQQLSLQATSLAAQTELLARFRDELRQIRREIKDPINALKAIDQKLKALPCEEIDWLKFEEQFRNVHPEFRKKLQEKYPDLTNQELRLCQLLRTGLKSHEAARLMCITERGVENHRFNIRKKLALKTEQSLTKFLSELV